MANLLVPTPWSSSKRALLLTWFVLVSQLFSKDAWAMERQWVIDVPRPRGHEFLLTGLHSRHEGGVLVVGKIFDPLGIGRNESLIVEALDTKGLSVWRQELPRLPNVGTMRLIQSLQTVDGALYIAYTGTPPSEGQRSEDVIIKLTPSGHILWQSRLQDLAPDTPDAAVFEVNSAGETVILGYRPGPDADGAYYTRCSLTKLDAEGRQVWVRVLNEISGCSPNQFSRTMSWDNKGSLYIALTNAVAKLDSEGDMLWFQDGRATGVEVWGDRVYATAPQATWALSPDGQVLWKQPLGGLSLRTHNGGLTLATVDFDTATSDQRLRLLQFDHAGRLLWNKPYTATPSSTFEDFAVATNGTIQVFTNLGIRKGPLKIVQPTMALLTFDQQGREIGRIMSQDTYTAWRYLVHTDGSVFLGDLEGSIEMFRATRREISPCPWYKPRCR